MSEPSVTHGMFRLERTYDTKPARVFRAWSDPVAKHLWFNAPNEEWVELERAFDFRVGGHDRLVGRWKTGMISAFSNTYFDIVENNRIIYAYEMALNGVKISVSLATVEIRAEGAGTKMVVTEHGAFIDGHDDAGSREHGTAVLLDQLGQSLLVDA